MSIFGFWGDPCWKSCLLTCFVVIVMMLVMLLFLLMIVTVMATTMTTTTMTMMLLLFIPTPHLPLVQCFATHSLLQIFFCCWRNRTNCLVFWQLVMTFVYLSLSFNSPQKHRHPFLLTNVALAFLALASLPFVIFHLPETMITPDVNSERFVENKRSARPCLYVFVCVIVYFSLWNQINIEKAFFFFFRDSFFFSIRLTVPGFCCPIKFENRVCVLRGVFF